MRKMRNQSAYRLKSTYLTRSGTPKHTALVQIRKNMPESLLKLMKHSLPQPRRYADKQDYNRTN
jgi:hypothetical protein